MYLNKTYVMQHFAKARSPCCVAACSKTHTHQPTYGHCVYMYLNKTYVVRPYRSRPNLHTASCVQLYFARDRCPCCVATCSKTHAHQLTYGCVVLTSSAPPKERVKATYCQHTGSCPTAFCIAFYTQEPAHVAEIVVLYCVLHTTLPKLQFCIVFYTQEPAHVLKTIACAV